MAWARQPGAPEFPSCPLEVFEPREYDYKSLMEEYGFQASGGILGFLGPSLFNYIYRKPFYSGIWNHLIAGIGLSYVGLTLRNLRRTAAAEKDDSLRQYIALHPEDFPPYKKVLYKDVLKRWTPIR